MTFGNRLTVTVGLRYDYMHTEIPVQVKTAAAGDLARRSAKPTSCPLTASIRT